MAPDLETVQRLVTAFLNLAVAVLAGASATRLWLARGDAGWSVARRRSVRLAALGAALAALALDLVLLWLVSATSAEVPLAEAGPAVRMMLGSTHLGLAWAIGMAALAVAAGAASRPAGGAKAPLFTLAGLAVFWYTRGMVSHAAVDGDLSIPLLADWLHLGLISLWVGEVILAGGIVLRPRGDMMPADRQARAAYVRSLSGSATLALIGIFVTGFYASWRHLGGWENLAGNPYGNTLLAKLLLVAGAATLGGFNRFAVMPPWLAQEFDGQAAPGRLPAKFRRILVVEALVLLAVLVLAAWLASTPPPGESM